MICDSGRSRPTGARRLREASGFQEARFRSGCLVGRRTAPGRGLCWQGPISSGRGTGRGCTVDAASPAGPILSGWLAAWWIGPIGRGCVRVRWRCRSWRRAGSILGGGSSGSGWRCSQAGTVDRWRSGGALGADHRPAAAPELAGVSAGWTQPVVGFHRPHRVTRFAPVR